MKQMKKISILAVLVIMASACTNDSSTTSGTVALKASAFSTTGKTSLTARTAANTVVITDFKINIANIKFEVDDQDDMYNTDPSHEDIKLNGPFLLDLIDPNNTLSQIITSVNVPNAKYEEVEFKFEKSIQAGEMNGKTYMIKGTIDGKAFIIWSGKDAELEVDFEDLAKDFTVNGNDISLNIKIHLDAIMAKIATLASQNLLLDTDGDGVIEISTDNDDGHNAIGEQIKNLLENETHLDDKD
jgi:ABC-type glycerol-3-phosphate transport system substrate-binding protein